MFSEKLALSLPISFHFVNMQTKREDYIRFAVMVIFRLYYIYHFGRRVEVLIVHDSFVNPTLSIQI